MATDDDLAVVPGSGCDERLFAPQLETLRDTVHIHVVENAEQPRIDRLARAALERLPTIAVPTLVPVGDQDTLAPAAAATATALAIPNAELVTVPGSGHITTLEASAAVIAALQHWLHRIRQNADTPMPASDPSTARTTL